VLVGVPDQHLEAWVQKHHLQDCLHAIAAWSMHMQVWDKGQAAKVQLEPS